MMCLTPFTIKNPKLRRKPEDLYINVPCGKCTACLKRRASQWVFRLKQEERIAHTAVFMTYTYNEMTVPNTLNGFLTLDRSHHSLYMKRLRKQLNKEKRLDQKHPLKYYMVGEYGSKTERPHYHSIMFNLPQFYIDNEHKIKNLWGLGNIQIDNCTPASMAYVTKYVNKQTFFNNQGPHDDRVPEFSFMSKGLGKNYLTEQQIKSHKEKLNPYITTEDGQKLAFPRYFKDKIFDDREKDKLQKAALEHILENPIFAADIDKQNFIKNEATKRQRESKLKRGNI